MEVTTAKQNNNSMVLTQNETPGMTHFNGINIHKEPAFEALKTLHNDFAERINNAQNVFSNFGSSIKVFSGKMRKMRGKAKAPI